MRNVLRSGAVVLGLICFHAGLSACGDDESSDDASQRGDDAAVPSKAGRSAGRSGGGGAGTSPEGGTDAHAAGGAAGAAGTSADAGSGMRVVDADIAAVLNTVNTGEIALGNLALSHSATTLARDYAQTMINEHSAAEERQSALFRSFKIAPTDNPLRAQIEREAGLVKTRIEGLAPGEFDLAYARSQIDMHDSVLRLIDETLLPSAEQAMVRTELMLTRAEVQRHLTLAMTLVAAIQFTADIDAGSDDAGL
jgi:putative membrane protein